LLFAVEAVDWWKLGGCDDCPGPSCWLAWSSELDGAAIEFY
jgi:hypothetical protein